MWYPVKAHHNGHNLSIVSETLSLSPFMSQSQYNIARGRVPKLGEGVELGGRVRYSAKVLRNRYNLFAGTEMISLPVYEPIAMQILLGGPSPNLGRGGKNQDFFTKIFWFFMVFWFYMVFWFFKN